MEAENTGEITRLLLAWRSGDESALAALMPQVQKQLKHIAGCLMSRERDGHTLVTTALVNEAYLRMVDLGAINWNDRSHFYAMCARIMRRVLVDHARAARRKKRTGDVLQVQAPELISTAGTQERPDLVALDDALSTLSKLYPDMARVVELRFFGGLDRDAISEVTGMSTATVTRRWRAARAWLIDELNPDSP